MAAVAPIFPISVPTGLGDREALADMYTYDEFGKLRIESAYQASVRVHVWHRVFASKFGDSLRAHGFRAVFYLANTGIKVRYDVSVAFMYASSTAAVL